MNPILFVVLPLAGPEGSEGYETGDDEGCIDQYGYDDAYIE